MEGISKLQTFLSARSAAVHRQLGSLVQRWNAEERMAGTYCGAEESVFCGVFCLFFYYLFIYFYFILFFKSSPFNLFLLIYFWLCWVFVSMRGLSLVVASGGHSSSLCVGLSLSRPLLLQSTGSRHASSVVVAHGPSCSAARGILPDQGSNPCPVHQQADSQPLHHQGSPIYLFIYFGCAGSSLWHAGSLVAACRLLVVACELLVAACMQDLVPRPGIEHWPPAFGAWSLTHRTTKEVPEESV